MPPSKPAGSSRRGSPVKASGRGSPTKATPKATPNASGRGSPTKASGSGKKKGEGSVRGSARGKGGKAKRKANPLGGALVDQSSDVPIPEQLRQLLTTHAVRVTDLFRSWDRDGDGFISRAEFHRAFSELGFVLPDQTAEVDAVFDSFDKDRSGSLDYNELNKQLHRTGGYTAPPAPAAQQQKEQRFALRHGPSGSTQPLAGAQLDVNSGVPLQQQLRELLTTHSVGRRPCIECPSSPVVNPGRHSANHCSNRCLALAGEAR